MGIRVLILRPDSTRGYDVTDRIEGLQWSNVNPGGHERCSFTLKGEWGRGFPEVRRGNIVRIEDGVQELFTGRIDEQDPQVADAEQVSVTAYGLGVRMKDDTMREIYVDRDLGHWRGPSVARKIAAVSGGIDVSDMQVTPDTTNGQNSIELSLVGAWARTSNVEGVYDSQGIPIGSVYYAWKVNANISPGDANWSGTVSLYDNDTPSGSPDGSGDLISAATSGTGTVTSTTSNRVFIYLDLTYGTGPAGGNNQRYSWFFPVLAVYGKHGLTKRGVNDTSNAQGFYGSDIVRDIVNRLSSVGIEPRNIETSSFVISQLAFFDDVSHEDAITAASKFDDVDWGVWGANSVTGEFADPLTGYLDWTARDASSFAWTVFRDECEELDLHTEIGSTYDQVAVSYSDPSGGTHRVLRTIDSPALDDAGIPHRTAPLQGGTLTPSGAQQLGDAFLALSDGQPVSRGQAIIRGSARSNTGPRPAHFMRADGSNILIPDAFPDRDVFTLHQVSVTDAPQPDNPSAAVDAANWSIGTGFTSVVRDTSTFNSSPASIQGISPGAPVGSYFQGTVTGIFHAGVEYTLTIWVKVSVVMAIAIEFGLLGTDSASSGAVTPADTGWHQYTIRWTPSADRTGVTIRLSKGLTTAININVDDAIISAPAPTADRRSVFPIKRVTVDASGDEPVTTVELDQTHDLLSILLARLQTATGIVLGGG